MRGVLLPSLPYAKGAHNYFLGEFEDAGQIGVLTGLLRCARKDELFLKNLPWASLRSAQTMSATLLAFGSMSTLGIDYRQYGLSPKYPKDFLDVYDIRSENTAETWTGIGVAVGAVVGALSVGMWQGVSELVLYLWALGSPLPSLLGSIQLVPWSKGRHW